MTKKEAIHFLYQIADEIQSFLDKTSSPKGQWTSHKRLEALSMAISALYDLFQAEEDDRLIIPPCKVGDTVWVITGTAIKLCTVDRIHILGNGQVQMLLNREFIQFNQAIIMAISALRTQQKQENECAKCSGIVYRQTDSGKIIPVGQRCGAKITPPCYVPDGDGCAYQIYGDNDDEPIGRCKSCPLCQSDKIRHKQESVHNDPLVLDELRQMRGEPVWCKELECYGIVKMEKVGSWANELFLVGTWHNGDAAVNFEYDIKSRGLTLYRHKPEEGAV